MGAFRKLKLIKDAMSPDAIRQGLAASRQGPTEEQLAALTPEQRAAYDAAMAQAAAAEAQVAADAQARAEADMGRRALGGAAGEHVHGPAPTPAGAPPTIEDQLALTKEQFKDVLRNPLGRRKAPAPPAPPVSADREEQAAAERAARDAARAPYLAPGAPPLTITRIATRDKTQLGEVAAVLGSSGLAGRPDLVHGVYRVPDHIGGGLTLGRSRVVEWDIVHAADTPLPPAAPPTAAFFQANERWVARGVGEPSVLDEDLALAYLGHAGLGPEQCLGISRLLQIGQAGGGEGETSYTLAKVTGVHAWHVAGLADGVFDRLRAARPIAVGPVPGVRVEVLNWSAIAAAVHPQTHKRFTVPSPFPHLPSTPQELLRSHLQIVGVRPADSYAAEVTEDEPRDLTGVGSAGFMTTRTNVGEEQPCADGKARRRLTGGSRVVVVYRDREEYAAGRERWAAYERDVLEASLANGTGVRRPVEQLDWVERLPGPARGLLKSAAWVADFIDGDGDDPFADIPPHRYCWPPS